MSNSNDDVYQMLNECLSNPQIGWMNDTYQVDHPITSKFITLIPKVRLSLFSLSRYSRPSSQQAPY